MYCHEIQLENFRNIKNATVRFREGVNLLVGDNAQGKTNMLEAVYFATIGKSFRGASSDELISFGEESSNIVMQYHDSVRMSTLSVKISSDRQKIIEQNGVKIRRLSEMVGQLRAVLFVPEHLSLIKEGPSERRNWLDVALCQLYPRYLTALSRFNKLLKNRNRLLKDSENDFGSFAVTVDFWSEQMSREASIVTAYRQEYIKRASEHVSRFFSDMTGNKETVELIYSPSVKLPVEECGDTDKVYEEYVKLLTSNYQREMAAGTSLWGIHKDDIDIKINGRAAREFASQGQQRSISLAMKLAEGEICREITGDDPIFLFDDVLSELDINRRTYLLSELNGVQVIMTGCDRSFTGDAHVISVENGNYYAEDVEELDEPTETVSESDEDEDMKVF